MGNDSVIVQAARVNAGAGTKKARNDAGLIHYLMRHWQSTPFEMCEMTLHVKLASQYLVNKQGRGTVLGGEDAARGLAPLKSNADCRDDHFAAMLGQGGHQGLAGVTLPDNNKARWYRKTSGNQLTAEFYLAFSRIKRLFIEENSTLFLRRIDPVQQTRTGALNPV
ncbi:FAD-dependent thymidylate synthase [Pseudoruegeria sp. SK021]|uniref:FAD-dependent thymidylate synthase n=1 Tax=Pseudoruegeria sp. SK021 TaxID=1933035 RepID=UPI000A26501B|nr:FAD-dependent thymidylate synthase [Pseudoruegeria sp. SK021]OSP54245.1 hypothetical protein BV911_13365 [Pseudoruegeria sp. SK021]